MLIARLTWKETGAVREETGATRAVPIIATWTRGLYDMKASRDSFEIWFTLYRASPSAVEISIAVDFSKSALDVSTTDPWAAGTVARTGLGVGTPYLRLARRSPQQ